MGLFRKMFGEEPPEASREDREDMAAYKNCKLLFDDLCSRKGYWFDNPGQYKDSQAIAILAQCREICDNLHPRLKAGR